MTRKTSLATAALTVSLAVGMAACGTTDQRADLPTQSPTTVDPGPARVTSASGTPTASSAIGAPSSGTPDPSATSRPTTGAAGQSQGTAKSGTGVRADATSDGRVSGGTAPADGSKSASGQRDSAFGATADGSGSKASTGSSSTGDGAGTLSAATTKRPSSRPVSVSVVSSSGRTLLTQSIGPVGLTNGELNPPGGVAGWYSGGGYVRPGYAGTSVLVGHITHAGAPDTFYNLPKARPGDRVLIRYKDGSQMAFRVTQSAGRDKKAAQYDGSIWGKTSGPSIRLITCDLNTRIRAGHRTGNWVVWASPA